MSALFVPGYVDFAHAAKAGDSVIWGILASRVVKIESCEDAACTVSKVEWP